MFISDASSISLPDKSVQEVVCTRNVKLPHLFVDCLSNTEAPAIGSTVQGERPLSHSDLRAFITCEFDLSRRGIERQSVVAVVMPNGPELAVTLLACMCQCKVAPLDPTMSKVEFESAFMQLGVTHAITLREHKVYDSDLVWACFQVKCQLQYVLKLGQQAGIPAWVEPSVQEGASTQSLNEMGDVALLLRTSGTTSKPKVVPLTPCGLYTGAVCIGRGLSLKPQDIALNVMPLTHIGGISCSLLSSIFAGSSVICAPAFDPSLFVHWLEKLQPTWYYAAPTIHKAVALFAKSLPQPLRHKLRLIRSGAANLADSDARELQEIFNCTVLPTYSMSECMPIAQPPLSYDLSKPGTVGVPIASSLRIADSKGDACKFGQDGEVCIRGPVVTSHYLDNEEANAACFSGDPDADGFRWFSTGDVGHLDKDGFLYLTGRSKELIKRGGDQVSPYEVEEALLGHAAVQTAVVFGVPNEFWGEEVAAVVVLNSGYSQRQTPATMQVCVESQRSVCTPSGSSSSMLRSFAEVSAEELMEFVAKTLPENKVPRQVVFLSSADDLPKTRTGKYMRVGLAAKLAVQAVDLAALNNLANVAVGSSPAPPPVKPNKAIYGLRYFVAIWVMFIHIGKMPDPISAWRSFSPSMPAFFILAGFLLASSTTRPVRCASELWNFYKNRIVAAHPLYLLSIVFTLPITFIVCTPGVQQSDFTYVVIQGIPVIYKKNSPMGPSESVFCPAELHQDEPLKYWGQIATMLAALFFAQTAWPWGIKYILAAYGNGVIWFTSAYYFSLLLFPFLFWMIKRVSFSWWDSKRYLIKPYIIRYVFAPVLITWALVTVFTWTVFNVGVPLVQRMVPDYKGLPGGPHQPWGDKGTMTFLIPYVFPPVWCGEFFMGMLCFNLFEMNRRDPQARLWPHWGKFTDFLTFCILAVLPVASILQVINPGIATSNPLGPPQGVFQTFSFLYSGEFTVRFCTAFLCIWIYGLATGEGYTAKFLGQRLFVQHLGPASYSMYLFHYAIAYYWIMAVHSNIGRMEPEDFAKLGFEVFSMLQYWLDWWEYIVIVLITSCWAVFCTHVINAPLTSVFMRFIDCITSPCCKQRGSFVEQSTLLKVADSIKGLSGADVDATTPLMECGLDSFGTSALVGILRPKFPGVSINPLQVYDLGTVGALADMIDAQLGAGGSACEGGQRLVEGAVPAV